MNTLNDRTKLWAVLLSGGGLFSWRQTWAGSVFLQTGSRPFFLATGVAFFCAYRMDHTRWWALIPAGTLLTPALVAWLGSVWRGAAAG